jgi:CheY-like chemotaxis protein
MGFITRSIGRRITKALDDVARTPEGKAALERVQGQMALADIALEIAGSGLDDSSACAELRKRLSEHPRAAGDAIEHLGALRTSYLDDRAYRLLTAAVDDGAVRPIDPAVRGQFLAEAKLGRLPLKDGFEYLASLEPRLHDLPPRRLADLRQKPSGFTSSRSEPGPRRGLGREFAPCP